MKIPVSFQKSTLENDQFRELQALVQQKVASLPGHRLGYARLRAIFYPLLFLSFYLLALQQQNQLFWFFILYMAMGGCMVLIFLNLVHEAVHNNLFRKKSLNTLMLHVFDLLGANSYIWKRRHTLLHHNFPNVAGWDADIEQASLLRIFPHEPLEPIHKLQPKLMFFFYPFYLANWLLVRDFKDFFGNRPIIRKVTHIPLVEYGKLFLFKTVFISYMLILPVWVGFGWGQTVFAFLLLLLTANNFALFVLLTPHINTTNAFPQPNSQNKLPDSWFVHQLRTTNDITGNNWFLRNILGNFNFHLAHHLFPQISYVYAPEITQIIKEHAVQHQLPYRSYSLPDALAFHYQLIKNNALGPEILEEDM
jgi:linoleoyl-CoA desaturase